MLFVALYCFCHHTTVGSGKVNGFEVYSIGFSYELCCEQMSSAMNRNIVDKMQQHKLELRDLWVSLDTSQLHGNADRPGYYQAWICAPDFMLPPRGTSHRAPKMSAEDARDMKATELNDFTSCDLWKLQGFPKDKVPAAVPENSFHVPMARAFLQSNDTRKNLTDSQETGQWLSGEAFWTAVLEGSFGILAHIRFSENTLRY